MLVAVYAIDNHGVQKCNNQVIFFLCHPKHMIHPNQVKLATLGVVIKHN